jgi:hypothetical protein
MGSVKNCCCCILKRVEWSPKRVSSLEENSTVRSLNWRTQLEQRLGGIVIEEAKRNEHIIELDISKGYGDS